MVLQDPVGSILIHWEIFLSIGIHLADLEIILSFLAAWLANRKISAEKYAIHAEKTHNVRMTPLNQMLSLLVIKTVARKRTPEVQKWTDEKKSHCALLKLIQVLVF